MLGVYDAFISVGLCCYGATTLQLGQWQCFLEHTAAVKGSPYSITKLRVPDLLPVLASQMT